jgi:peptidoglycan L-alanyl-D-glutamate endopeptidase CwlK
MSGFFFGDTSKKRLSGVHPDLIKVLNTAITITKVDFGIACGVRTAKEQNELYKKGLSDCDGYKIKSPHQIQKDGYGHAVDVYIWDDKNHKGVFVYDKNTAWMWLEVGRAILRSARLHDIDMIWGLTFDIGSGYDIDHFQLKD